MSNTPETDLQDDLCIECDDSCVACYVIKSSTGEEFTGDFVPAEFARRLERERDGLRGRVAELVSALEWIAETPDAWLERDAPDGATVYGWRYSKHFLDIAREALAKTKEAK
jgi:hypothetical protein